MRQATGELTPGGHAFSLDGAVALRDVAFVYGLFESQVAGRPVTIEEVESSAVDAYQREMDVQLGLIPDESEVSG